MKKRNLALLILTALSVTACSSGGGNSPSVTTPAAETPKPAEQPKAPETPSTPATPSTPDNQKPTTYTQAHAIVGGGFIIPTAGGRISSATLKSDDLGDFNYVQVEEKSIELIPFNTNSFEANDAKNTHYAYKGDDTIAAYLDKDGFNNRYLFVIGKNATQNMPTSGTFNYEGNGLSAYADNSGQLSAITPTKVTFSANFDNKNLTGRIESVDSTSAFIPVDISADITKNTFTGEKEGITVQGGFFGNNASELAGDYAHTKTQNSVGVFRATHQK